jgi:monoamine oxidase
VSTFQLQSNKTMKLSAQKCVVAMGTGDVRSLTFSPPLPKDRAALVEKWPISSTVKSFLLYPRAFWREPNFLVDVPIVDEQGGAETSSPAYMTSYTYYDASPAVGAGVLSTYYSGVGTNAEERRQIMTDSLVSKIVWEGWTPDPLLYQEFAHSHYSPSFMSPNMLTTYGHTWREPFGR